MIIQVGDVLKATEGDKKSIIAIPANSRIKTGGQLVMGAGFAKQVADMHPTMPHIAGMAMRGNYIEGKGQVYGFCFIPGTRFALFQSKISPFDPSTLDLIETSIRRMLSVTSKKKFKTGNPFNIKEVGVMPFDHIHIPIPGVGLGGLDRDDVLELFETLLPEGDDRFVLWEKEAPAQKEVIEGE